MNQMEDGRPEAVRRADAGVAAWRGVVHAQQGAPPDPGEFYELAGFMVETLRVLEALVGVLARQVAGYADSLPGGRVVYDDSRRVSPRTRLEMAVSDLQFLSRSTSLAGADATVFWSSIGHIGVEDANPRGGPDGPADSEVTR